MSDLKISEMPGSQRHNLFRMASVHRRLRQTGPFEAARAAHGQRPSITNSAIRNNPILGSQASGHPDLCAFGSGFYCPLEIVIGQYLADPREYKCACQ